MFSVSWLPCFVDVRLDFAERVIHFIALHLRPVNLRCHLYNILSRPGLMLAVIVYLVVTLVNAG